MTVTKHRSKNPAKRALLLSLDRELIKAIDVVAQRDLRNRTAQISYMLQQQLLAEEGYDE